MCKRILVTILSLSLLLCMCSCNSKTYDEYEKVADNLYQVTCDEYDYDYLLKDGKGNVEFLEGGCSAIKEGNYLGRNFDFVAGDAAEIVVKTTPKDGRYATMGVVGGLLWLTTDFMESGLNKDSKKLLPLMILDGINEQGLAVEINCVNSADAGGITKHTNPGKPQIHQLSVVRYLLDNAKDADEAVELMKTIDIVDTRDLMGLINFNFEVHFLITDKDKSYVVEFDNNKPNGEKLVIMEDETIMTNFYLHKANVAKNIFSDNAMGVERYKKLMANRDSVNSVDTMKELMQSIRFSNSNRTDGEYAPGPNYDNPFTCFSDHPVFGENGINYSNYKQHIAEILKIMKNDQKKCEKVLKDPKLSNPDNLWVTSHSVVYDLANKTMSIAIYERFDKYYDYSL